MTAVHQTRRPGEPLAIPLMLELFLSIPQEEPKSLPARRRKEAK